MKRLIPSSVERVKHSPGPLRCSYWKPIPGAWVALKEWERLLFSSEALPFLKNRKSSAAMGRALSLLTFMFAFPSPFASQALVPFARGNRAAEEIARHSKISQDSFRFLRASAMRIADPSLRKQVLELLDNPAPTFYQKSPTAEAKKEVFKTLLARGFVKASDERFPQGNVMSGIFPPVIDANQSPQRFWSAPGSAYDGHHSYPGGLVVHEAFNLRSALSLAANYRAEYPGMRINNDFVIAAPLWHDAMKVVVFQWKDDESELPELTIAGTGAHHILGIAEALHRRLPPRLVIAIAAAHGSPGFEPSGKIVDWIEAAAVLTHIDPVEYGVLQKSPVTDPESKWTLPWPTFPEATINNLSDGDFVLSVPAAHHSLDVLREIARSELMMKDADLRGQPFNHFRNQVFSQLTQERFYSVWSEGSWPAVQKELRRLGLLPKN